MTMPSQAWPFLISRGRRAGYRTLLAPLPLLTDYEYAVLEDHVQPSAIEDQPDVIDLVTRAGRPISVVHATHRVTATDLGQSSDPKDEHGRPLQLLYGFVCSHAGTLKPDQTDLRAARAAALEVYRRFLEDEDEFPLGTGRPFPLHSTFKDLPPPPPATVMPDRRHARRGVLVVTATVLLAGMFLLLRQADEPGEHSPPHIGCPTPLPPAAICPGPLSPQPVHNPR